MKGVAVPYVVGMILGVTIIFAVGYWFFRTGGKGTGSVTEEDCRRKAIIYCTQWAADGYNTKPGGLDFSDNTCPPGVTVYAPECCFFPWAQSLGQSDCEDLRKV